MSIDRLAGLYYKMSDELAKDRPSREAVCMLDMMILTELNTLRIKEVQQILENEQLLFDCLVE